MSEEFQMMKMNSCVGAFGTLFLAHSDNLMLLISSTSVLPRTCRIGTA